MDSEGELWGDIPGYEGRYQCSTLGRVRSLPRVDRRGRKWAGKMLKPNGVRGKLGHSPVLTVYLATNGEIRSFSIRRLVLMTFIGMPRGHRYAKHRDANLKSDVSLSNTRWSAPPRKIKSDMRLRTTPLDRRPAPQRDYKLYRVSRQGIDVVRDYLRERGWMKWGFWPGAC